MSEDTIEVPTAKQRKERLINVRVSDAEHSAIEEAARSAGMSVSAFFRSLLLEGAGVRPILTAEDRLIMAALLEDMRMIGISSGFGDRRYAYSVETRNDGSLKVEGYVVLRSGQGERLTADAKAAAIVQERFNASAVAKEAPAAFSFTGYGNGVEYGAAKLRDLIAQWNDVRDDQGCSIPDDKAAGDLVQKEWRDELHSRKSRDVKHVIMSARAGTDAVAFEGAVRDFLAEQFAGHRYVFAMHDPENDPKDIARRLG